MVRGARGHWCAVAANAGCVVDGSTGGWAYSVYGGWEQAVCMVGTLVLRTWWVGALRGRGWVHAVWLARTACVVGGRGQCVHCLGAL